MLYRIINVVHVYTSLLADRNNTAAHQYCDFHASLE